MQDTCNVLKLSNYVINRCTRLCSKTKEFVKLCNKSVYRIVFKDKGVLVITFGPSHKDKPVYIPQTHFCACEICEHSTSLRRRSKSTFTNCHICIRYIKAQSPDRHIDGICLLCQGCPVELASSKLSAYITDGVVLCSAFLINVFLCEYS